MGQMAPMVEQKLGELVVLCGEHRVRRLSLFGSALTSRFDVPRSDVDLLVEFEPMPPMGHARHYLDLLTKLECLLGRSVDLVEPQAVRNPYLRKSIERNLHTLYGAA